MNYDYSGITPLLTVDGAADALAFYAKAFGAEEINRVTIRDGRIMHAVMRINGDMLHLGDMFPELGGVGSPLALGGTTVTLHIETPDADALFSRAIAAGATPIVPIQEMFWGQRYGQLRDPFGHRWSIGTPRREISQRELQEGATRYFP